MFDDLDDVIGETSEPVDDSVSEEIDHWDESSVYKPTKINKDKLRRNTKTYALVANSNVPKEIVDKFVAIARRLDAIGFKLHTDGNVSEETDKNRQSPVTIAISKVAMNKQEFVPWKKFGSGEGKVPTTPSFNVAAAYHTVFGRMVPVVKMFLARSVEMIIGSNHCMPVEFLVCWSEDGEETPKQCTAKTGNVGFPIRIAAAADIPIFNLSNESSMERFKEFLGTIISN